jgi:hypothetical protein
VVKGGITRDCGLGLSLRHEFLERGLFWTLFLNMSFHFINLLLPAMCVVVVFVGGRLLSRSRVAAARFARFIFHFLAGRFTGHKGCRVRDRIDCNLWFFLLRRCKLLVLGSKAEGVR